MSRAEDHHRAEAVLAAARHVLGRWRQWWRQRGELDTMHPDDIAGLARDLAVSGPELRALVARGPGASRLLHERMRALGVAKDDVERIAPRLMRDLERTCAFCADKRECERDLAVRPESLAWAAYCPNAEVLTAVRIAKERAPAQPALHA